MKQNELLQKISTVLDSKKYGEELDMVCEELCDWMQSMGAWPTNRNELAPAWKYYIEWAARRGISFTMEMARQQL